jgi:hypothetical protein
MTGISQREHAGSTNRSTDGRFGLPDWLHFAAMPIFALTALLTSVSNEGQSMRCLGMAGSSALDSTGLMYLLMSPFTRPHG